MAEEENKEESKAVRKFSLKSVAFAAAGILLLAGICGTGYFYRLYSKTKALLSDSSTANKAESEEIINKLKKLMLLPSDEQPSIATVLDVEKLKDQPFFAKAENGDKVIVYTESQIAILYSPGKNLIVNVAPISTQDESQTQTGSIKVALLNGTATVGLTHTAENKLKSQFSGIEVVSKTNAAKADYQKSIIIDLTGTNNSIVSSIASIIDADVAQLPEGETAPTGTDVLIIIGANYK